MGICGASWRDGAWTGPAGPDGADRAGDGHPDPVHGCGPEAGVGGEPPLPGDHRGDRRVHLGLLSWHPQAGGRMDPDHALPVAGLLRGVPDPDGGDTVPVPDPTAGL